ncbi:MAG: Rieske 2Fe-2S domain-containing protein [Myxococcota bacterium]|nr:Rieske 2Fe-2S domain-containing protein [Myxococcota bacterium]
MSQIKPKLHPDEPATRISVARLSGYWYPVCFSKALRKKPMACTVLGMPLVVFRSGEDVGALVDRCPHRNVPLSEGSVVDNDLQCPYHGWRFDRTGTCTRVPGFRGSPEHRGRKATSWGCTEKDGLVWVYAKDVIPDDDPGPPDIPGVGQDGYTVVRAELDFPGTLHATLENALDVPHTAFLHGGLFRSEASSNRIECRVVRDHSGVECEYIGEPAPTGLIGRILAPGGGVTTHYDRFLLPSTAQVEYRLGERSHLIATNILTPITDFLTRMYAVVAVKLPVPGALVRPVIEPVIRKILRQDAEMLAKQTDNIQRFGGERYTSTEVDVLGPHIWHLLKMAERGELEQVERSYRTTFMET